MGDRRKKLQRQPPPPVQGQPSAPGDTSQTQIISQTVQWSGSILPPGIVKQYDYVVHDGAERVFRLTEEQARHRMRMENRASRTESFQRVSGSVFGPLIGLAGVAGGVFLIYTGNDISGLSTLLVSLGTLVTAIRATAEVKKVAGTAQAPGPPPPSPSPPQLELPLPQDSPRSEAPE